MSRRETKVGYERTDGLRLKSSLASYRSVMERPVRTVRLAQIRRFISWFNCDGMIGDVINKGALWDSYSTATPKPLTPSDGSGIHRHVCARFDRLWYGGHSGHGLRHK